MLTPAGLKNPRGSTIACTAWLARGTSRPHFSKIVFSGFTWPAVVFSYFYFYDTCILNVFLTNKV